MKILHINFENDYYGYNNITKEVEEKVVYEIFLFSV